MKDIPWKNSDPEGVQTPPCDAPDIWRAGLEDLPANAVWEARWGPRGNPVAHVERERILSRRLTEAVLRGYVGENVAGKIRRDSRGRPFLDGGALDFNLSHSGGWVVLAVIQGARVGVDIERRRPERDLAGIARRFFASEENAELRKFPEGSEAWVGMFYRNWTAKEAGLKASGAGLAGGMATTRIADSAAPPRVILPDGEELMLAPVAVADGWSGAVAWTGPGRGSPRYFHWSQGGRT